MIYCTHCGHKNSGNNIFCENCGKELDRIVKPLVQSDFSKWIRRIPAIGGLIVLFGFFMPWVLVSCGGSNIFEATAFEIATGNYAQIEIAAQFGASPPQIDPQPGLWLIFLFGLLGLGSISGNLQGARGGGFVGVLGIIGLIIFTYSAQGIGREVGTGGLFKMEFQSGYWLAWLGFIVQALSLFTSKSKTHGPPS